MNAPSLAARLQSLAPDKLALLLHAFEVEESYYVEIGDGDFIGVNVLGNPHLRILQMEGAWASGQVNNARVAERQTRRT